jgi:aminoglycoside phosphotransferase (APT) family kinase protein
MSMVPGLVSGRVSDVPSTHLPPRSQPCPTTARADLPVLRVLWLEEDPGALGAPFFVMERVEGRVSPDVMPYTYERNGLHAANDDERARLEEATVSLIARLHDQRPVEPAEGSALRRHVEAQRAYYAWVVEGLPRSPLIESAFDWLDAHWPADEGETVLNWGDARIGNIILHHASLAAMVQGSCWTQV